MKTPQLKSRKFLVLALVGGLTMSVHAVSSAESARFSLQTSAGRSETATLASMLSRYSTWMMSETLRKFFSTPPGFSLSVH